MAVDKNGTVKIEISGDEMSAIAFIMPPEGSGTPASVADVKRALEQAGVIYGVVSNERIQAFIGQAVIEPVDFMAASGTPPGHGADASAAFMWTKDADIITKDEKAKIDLRELNLVKSVVKGEVIARRTPPTRGEEGVTVKGTRTPGEWGSDVVLKAGANVKVSGDGTEFVADIDGSPRVAQNTVSVDPVYVVNGDIDYETGNINFAGALEIRGNVLDGFIVKAGGNISIGGNVQAAEVYSEGDIVVKGGILTRKQSAVAAKGSVFAKYIENSIVEAEKDVVSERAIINSSVRSNGMVICSSHEGKIIGGDVMAYSEIRAKQLGTESETTTVLRAGFKFDVYIAMAEVEAKLETALTESERVKRALAQAKTAKPEAIAKLKEALASLEAEKANLSQRLAAMRIRMQVNPFATVKAAEAIHPGCMVYIGASRERITKHLKFATLMSDREGGIAMSSYDELTRKIKTVNVGTKEKKKTVLIVDDTKFMRSKLRNILECGNFKIAGEAEDGQQAVSMFERLKPDVVTMDITMPNMDGISSLKEIKKQRPEAKVIMISALGLKEQVRDSLVAEASDFILKPFVPEEVLEVISRIADR